MNLGTSPRAAAALAFTSAGAHGEDDRVAAQVVEDAMDIVFPSGCASATTRVHHALASANGDHHQLVLVDHDG